MEINNEGDFWDSRDILARIEELQAVEEYDLGEQSELKMLLEFAEEGEGLTDWEYGVTFIRDSHFRDYAIEMAEEIGATSSQEPNAWPHNCIDWDQAARELQWDYTCIYMDGIAYWAR
jgi:hypothetical protein